MQLADLLRENLEVDAQDAWENERTPTPVRCFAVRLRTSARRWLRRFRHDYNQYRPNQALDGATPAEEVLN
jgi:hypothetical protein